MKALISLISAADIELLLDASTWANRSGRFRPGLRALGERHGMSAATAYRKMRRICESGIVSKHHPGGSATCRYQIAPEWLDEVLKLRDQHRADWHDHWRKPSAAAAAFTDPEPPRETKGNPYSKSPNPTPEPSQPSAAPTRDCTSRAKPDPAATSREVASARAKHIGSTARLGAAPAQSAARTQARARLADKPQRAEGCAKPTQALPFDLEAQARSSRPERLHPRMQAAAWKPVWSPPRRAEAGETLKLFRKTCWRENLSLFVVEHGTWEEQLAFCRDDAETIGRFDRWMRSSRWQAPDHVRARHKLHQRGSGDPAERERRFHILAGILSNRLPSQISQSDWWNVVIPGVQKHDPACQRIFDLIDAEYRRNRPTPRRGGPQAYAAANREGDQENSQKSRRAAAGRTLQDKNVPTRPAENWRKTADFGDPIFHNKGYATPPEVLAKASSDARRAVSDLDQRTLPDERFSTGANTWCSDTGANRERTTDDDDGNWQKASCFAKSSDTTVKRSQSDAARSVGDRHTTIDRGSARSTVTENGQGRVSQHRSGAEPAGGPEPLQLAVVRSVGEADLARAAAEVREGVGRGGVGGLGAPLSVAYVGISKRARRKTKFSQIEGLPPSTWLVPR